MSDEMERILEGRARKWLFTQANEPSILAEEESFTDALRSACEEVVRRCEGAIAKREEEWKRQSDGHRNSLDDALARECNRDAATLAHAANILRTLFPTAFPENPDE